MVCGILPTLTGLSPSHPHIENERKMWLKYKHSVCHVVQGIFQLVEVCLVEQQLHFKNRTGTFTYQHVMYTCHVHVHVYLQIHIPVHTSHVEEIHNSAQSWETFRETVL